MIDDRMSSLLMFVQHHLWWLAGGSLVMLLLGLIAGSWLVMRMPADYFCRRRPQPLVNRSLHPLLGWGLVLWRNLLGLVFVVAGLVMLVTPGQGVLTLLLGLVLMDYPGKFALERWLVRRPLVLRMLNLLRRRRGCPPLIRPPG